MGVGLTEDGNATVESSGPPAGWRVSALREARVGCAPAGGGQGTRGGPGLPKSARSEVRDPRDNAEGFTPRRAMARPQASCCSPSVSFHAS